MLRETRHKMWPVDRKWALREQSMSLEEFHDLEDVDDEDEEEKGDEDVEAGCHNQNYHFSPSVIKKRGFNTLHQVGSRVCQGYDMNSTSYFVTLKQHLFYTML